MPVDATFSVRTLHYSFFFSIFGFRLPMLRDVGIDLFSRLVAKQVFSAPHSLTSVFGMGTGGPCAIKTPTTVPVDVYLRVYSVLID